MVFIIDLDYMQSTPSGSKSCNSSVQILSQKHVIVELGITFFQWDSPIKNIPTWLKTTIHEKNILEENYARMIEEG